MCVNQCNRLSQTNLPKLSTLTSEFKDSKSAPLSALPRSKTTMDQRDQRLTWIEIISKYPSGLSAPQVDCITEDVNFSTHSLMYSLAQSARR